MVTKDLTGAVFGRATVEGSAPPRTSSSTGRARRCWTCSCSCGKTFVACGEDLRAGRTKSCGCLKLETSKALALARGHLSPGTTFGWLTVLAGDTRSDKYRNVLYPCRCSCQKLCFVAGFRLRDGSSKSCGCLRAVRAVEVLGLPLGQSAKNRVIHQYEISAQKRGLAFDLSRSALDLLFSAQCVYCGSPPSNVARKGKHTGSFLYSGIDRVDNDIGYVNDNVVSCCKLCNKMKRAMSVHEFLAWIERVALHRGFGARAKRTA